jgi:hypothetical protein
MLLILTFVIAGCQGDSKARSTPLPTRVPVTLTPRSTPLPEVASAPIIGEGPRQIELLLTLFGDGRVDSDTQDIANDLQQWLEDELELNVAVSFTNETDALEILCSGAPRAAWVSAYTFVKAQQACGAVPVLAVQRGRSPRIVVGQTAEIISRAVIGDVEQLQGLTFCRSTDQDYFTGWVFPRLLLTAEGIDLNNDLSAVKEYPTLMEMGRALYLTDCNAIALPTGEFEGFLDDLAEEVSTEDNPISSSDLEDVIHILQPAGEVTYRPGTSRWQFDDGVIPYEVLVFAPNTVIPEALRDEMIDHIEAFFDDRADGEERLDALLDATGLMRVDANSYSAFRSLVINAGWDMTAAD